MLTRNVLRGMCSSSPAGDKRLYDTHVPTTILQKLILGLGSSVMALADPYRGDMVAVNAEVTGAFALKSIRARMMEDDEGRAVLRERPRISTKTVDFDYLRGLPKGTLGNNYATYSDYHSITPDSREPVRFVDDEDLAYVLQRYREVHDVLHSVLDMPTNMVGEVAVKWVEALQTGLPMCVGGAILGPMRFTPRQVQQFRKIRPWAIRVGTKARFMMCVYYERRWEQEMEDFRREMNFDAPPTF